MSMTRREDEIANRGIDGCTALRPKFWDLLQQDKEVCTTSPVGRGFLIG